MRGMQRVFLIIVLVFLSILILFIPLKRNEGEAVETEEEMTPVAMLSMERLQPPPREPVETFQEKVPDTPSKETFPASATTLPVPTEEETGMKEEAGQRPEKTAKRNDPLEVEQQEQRGEDGYYYTIDMVTNHPQFDLSLLASRIVYPPLARRQGEEGTVLLRLFIDEKGVIDRIVVEEDPGFGFAEAAIKAFATLRVNPAILGTSPVPVTILYPIRFSLHNE
jgi:protein TonB